MPKLNYEDGLEDGERSLAISILDSIEELEENGEIPNQILKSMKDFLYVIIKEEDE